MANTAPDHPQDALARYRALLEINESIGAHRRFEDFFRELSRSLSRIISFEGMSISLYDTASRTSKLFLLETGSPTDFPVGQVFPLADSPGSVILETLQPLYIPDLEQETRFAGLRTILGRYGIRSYCVLPLATARSCLGGLHFGSIRPHAYTGEAIEFMRLTARQAAVVLESILNHEASAASQRELARERDHLSLLLRVSAAVADKLDTRELFAAISICLREALNVEYASLTLWDSENRCLRRHSLDFPGGAGFLQENAAIPVENTVVGEAFAKAAPIVASRAEIERMPAEISAGLLNEGLISLCAVPLVSRKQVLGTLNVASRREGAFSRADVKLLEEVAGQFAVALDNAFAYRHIERLNAKLAEEKLYLADEILSNYFLEEIIGNSAPLQKVLRQIEVVAPSDSTVLICGETGTGKELIARAVHNLSSRRQNTFVKVNCAAIPTGLLESELFGHEKGAFTDAKRSYRGLFAQSHQGTIFLDEIGDMSLSIQAKLLRVLQERRFYPLGSGKPLEVDMRVIVATNKDLEAEVKSGAFREDLFYRIHVIPIHLPPLRERKEDIPLLAEHFLKEFSRRMKKDMKGISAMAMQKLMLYDWPGNVRELENTIEHAVAVTRNDVISDEIILPAKDLLAEPLKPFKEAVETFKRDYLVRLLEFTKGNLSKAAELSGKYRADLYHLIRKHNINPGDFKNLDKEHHNRVSPL